MLRLDQQNKRRTRTPFALAECWVRACREQERRTNTPDQLAWPRRRQEDTGVDITQSIRSSRPIVDVRLINDRCNPTRDEQPVVVDVNWDHRLNVQYVLDAAKLAYWEIGVVLERHVIRLPTGF